MTGTADAIAYFARITTTAAALAEGTRGLLSDSPTQADRIFAEVALKRWDTLRDEHEDDGARDAHAARMLVRGDFEDELALRRLERGRRG